MVTKIKTWYIDESKEFGREISKAKMTAYFANLATELGVDPEGGVPFSATSIDWSEYQKD